jgi:hypothetical protein
MYYNLLLSGMLRSASISSFLNPTTVPNNTLCNMLHGAALLLVAARGCGARGGGARNCGACGGGAARSAAGGCGGCGGCGGATLVATAGVAG